MNESDNSKSNDTENNLLQAIRDYVPPSSRKYVIKMLYDPESGIIKGTTFDDEIPEGLSWVEITREQYLKKYQFTAGLRVIEGKPQIIRKESGLTKKRLTQGSDWHSDEDNMMIVAAPGTENARGWKRDS